MSRGCQRGNKKYEIPEIIHTDKGRQFMSDEFIRLFKEQGVKITGVSPKFFRRH